MIYTVQEMKIKRDKKIVKAVAKDGSGGVNLYHARSTIGAIVMEVILRSNMRKTWKYALKMGIILRDGDKWIASQRNIVRIAPSETYTYITFNDRVVKKSILKWVADIKYQRVNNEARSRFAFLRDTDTIIKVPEQRG